MVKKDLENLHECCESGGILGLACTVLIYKCKMEKHEILNFGGCVYLASEGRNMRKWPMRAMTNREPNKG